jgi:hypothetical protein
MKMPSTLLLKLVFDFPSSVECRDGRDSCGGSVGSIGSFSDEFAPTGEPRALVHITYCNLINDMHKRLLNM